MSSLLRTRRFYAAFTSSVIVFALTEGSAQADLIPISEVGTVDVLTMEYHPTNIPSCSPGACAVRTLAGADDSTASLAFDLEMTVDSITGEVTNGAMTVVLGQSVVLGSLANFTAVELEFLELNLTFSATGAGVLSGVIDGGVLNLIKPNGFMCGS